MKNLIYKNKTLLYAIVFVLIFCTVFLMVQDIARIAFADDTMSFDDSNVLDDLQSSTINGKPFDFLEYAFDETKSLRIINVVEYCYSYKANMRGNYALYIYVYNPQGVDIVDKSGQNKIQMVVSWTKNSDGEYVADKYEKFALKFCNKSEKSNYKGLFYKYKVVDREIDDKTMAERVNSMERRYDISGIELLTRGNTNATEYGVGGTYKFTGYAQGYGDSDESTLSCVVEDLETLELKIHHTYYRTNVSSLGKDHYNEVNTVYFSVPQRIFDTYGTLQKIHAEWWEYKTKMMAITSDSSFYEQLLSYAGTDVGEYDSNVPIWLYSGYDGYANPGYSEHYYEWCYNKYTVSSSTATYSYGNKSTILPMAFYSDDTDVESIFDFLYSKTTTAGDVKGAVVSDYIYSYSNDLGNGYIDCNDRQISKDLFETFGDDGRTMGYNNTTIDFGDTFDLRSYDSNHSWWDKLWDYGFSWPSTDGDYENVDPIVFLDDGILTGSADEYLVNKDDLGDLRAYYVEQKLLGNVVVLFRFANTDYYCAPARTSAQSSGLLENMNTYVAQMTCFFDFDIIDLTFNKDGNYVVIPAVSSPIDIINDITSPPSGLDWWKIVLMVVALILFVVLLAPILPYILQAIIWLIKLPFKIIGRVYKSFKKHSDKHKDKSSGVTKDDVDDKSKQHKKKQAKQIKAKRGK